MVAVLDGAGGRPGSEASNWSSEQILKRVRSKMAQQKFHTASERMSVFVKPQSLILESRTEKNTFAIKSPLK
jgi:serine/threonine protein phosphatase PrpC